MFPRWLGQSRDTAAYARLCAGITSATNERVGGTLACARLLWDAWAGAGEAEYRHALQRLDDPVAQAQNLHWMFNVACLAGAAVGHGDREQAERLIPVLRPLRIDRHRVGRGRGLPRFRRSLAGHARHDAGTAGTGRPASDGSPHIPPAARIATVGRPHPRRARPAAHGGDCTLILRRGPAEAVQARSTSSRSAAAGSVSIAPSRRYR